VALANANADDVAATIAGLGASVSRSAGGSTRSPGQPAPAPVPTGGGGGHAGGLFEGEVKISADKPTNSLVILATGRDYQTLRSLIQKLDIPRRQVFVEATILEISVDKSRKLGIAYHGGMPIGSGASAPLLFGGLEPSQDVNSILFSPASLSGLAAG